MGTRAQRVFASIAMSQASATLSSPRGSSEVSNAEKQGRERNEDGEDGGPEH
jgi:hypothetical protein